MDREAWQAPAHGVAKRWTQLKSLSMCTYILFPGGPDSKEYACNVGDLGLIPGHKDAWGKEWQPTPVFFPEESH